MAVTFLTNEDKNVLDQQIETLNDRIDGLNGVEGGNGGNVTSGVQSVNGFLPDDNGEVTIKYDTISDRGYRHNKLSTYPKNITVFSDERYTNNPYVFLGKNYWPTAVYVKEGFNKYGLTYETDGHNITVNGTATIGSGFVLSDSELNEKWALPDDISVGDVFRVYLFGKQSENDSPFVKVELYNESGTRLAYTQTRINVGSIYSRSGTLTIPEGVSYVRFIISYNAGSVFDNTIFPVLVKNDATILSDQQFVDGVTTVYTEEEILDICTAPYESTVSYKLELKEYIDSQSSNVNFDMNEIDNRRSFVTPEMFGAYADGVHDDVKAIQDCVDYAITNKIKMIGGNSYITSTPIIITGDQLDIDIKEIHYDGSDCAVISNGSYNKINIGKIVADNGSGFRLNSNITSSFGQYYIGQVYSSGNCVEYIVTQNGIVGNRLTFNDLKSINANCIYQSPESTMITGGKWNGNNNFIGGRLSKGEWGVYNAHGEDSYITCQFEGVKNGIRMMGVGNCRVIAPRYTELIYDAYDRIQEGYPIIDGQGIFFKVVSPTSLWIHGDSCRMSLELSPSGGWIMPGNIDLSENPLEYIYDDGVVATISKDVDAYKINAKIKTREGIILSDSFLIFGRNILIRDPNFTSVYHVRKLKDGYVGNFRETGKDSEFDIYSKFIIETNGCDYTLPPSYDTIAFNKFEIEQLDGCYATFRDWRGTVIFDGANYGAGLYELKAYSNNIHSWDYYDNRNQVWDIRKIDNNSSNQLHVGTTAPENATHGMIWIDTNE